jgi:magnesium-transporting ATPase (P-type)
LQNGSYGEDSAEVKDMYKKHFSEAEINLVTSVDEFARQGFRTLAFASRKLDSPEIDGVYTQEEIESQLTLCGVTSVEDLL